MSLVEQMLELHKQSAAARTPQDKERVARVPGKLPGIIKIESSADKGMIYRLTEEEIKIVEVKT